ncbi:phage tail protein [Pedobacter sp. SYSU D00535]|uniref:phage tail protein n=1 Tax=Pedobacter sp. SYSU D00535 TaxID=2810308 RepID=UPI001A972478|nr:tail fiber protein [Pedobacter sp. SYSU D00535]
MKHIVTLSLLLILELTSIAQTGTTRHVGEIRMFVGLKEQIPHGWLICNGQTLNITDYPELFQSIGTTFGGDGQMTFSLPDLRDRVPAGSGTMTPVGSGGGQNNVTLLESQIPSHSHNLMVSFDPADLPAGTAQRVLASSQGAYFYIEDMASIALHESSISKTGGGESFDNRSAFLSVHFIISTKDVTIDESNFVRRLGDEEVSGRKTFLQPISSSPPVNGEHLTTRSWVESRLGSLAFVPKVLFQPINNGLNGVLWNEMGNLDGYNGKVPNSPSGSWNAAFVSVGGANRGFQLVSEYSDNKFYIRKHNDAGWSTYRQFLFRDDIGSAGFMSTHNGGSLSNKIPFIDGNGTTELGKSLDFHSSNNNGNYDFDFRISTDETGNANFTSRSGTINTNNLQLGSHHLAFKESTVRDWSIKAANGDLNFSSGDRNGRIVFNASQIAIGKPAGGDYHLSVEGNIKAKSIKIEPTGWADYVFAPSYKLPPLADVEKFIQINKHLPGVPSEAKVIKDGIDVADMSATLLKKIEELTLYMIEMKKENEDLKGRLKKLEEKGLND